MKKILPTEEEVFDFIRHRVDRKESIHDRYIKERFREMHSAGKKHCGTWRKAVVAAGRDYPEKKPGDVWRKLHSRKAKV